MEKKIVVVGAGLVGSLWALMLAQKGFNVEVYEGRPDFVKNNFVGGRSINLALSDRGWKALDIVGISSKIKAIAIPMQKRIMHDLNGHLTSQPYGKEGEAIWSVSRGDLNIALIREAQKNDNIHFHFNSKCISFDRHNGYLTFEDTINSETFSKKADYIFATDGVFSAVRYSLQKLNRFNLSQQYLDHGYKELIIPAKGNKHQIDKNALHIWPRKHFMLIALANLDGSFTVTLFLPFKGEVSFDSLNDNTSITTFFKRYFSDALALMPDLLTHFNSNPTSALATIKCYPWQYKNTLLLGDAAHGIVPFYGQGMNSGFEDCSILFEMLEKNDWDLENTISKFAISRSQDTDAIADLAIRNFIEMRDKVGDPQFILRKKIASHLQEYAPDRFVPLYSMVTFSDIPYSKALSETKKQDDMFAEILKVDNISSDFKNDIVYSIFNKYY